MDLMLPYSWIKQYLKTTAAPEKFAECLSLCGPTVDYSKKVADDTIFQFDITHNRVDCASVIGICREASAILPMFDIPAKVEYPEPINRNYQVKKSHPYLDVKIDRPTLCSRFSTILLKNIKIKPSSRLVQDRLEKSGMRPINNVVDISNYLMLETGQPIHTFDYDKIKDHKMLLRESKKGEKIITLDGVERTLPGGDIVIEDGSGKLIDLCGIMGGKLSEVDDKTKNVLLFVQNYDPQRIRRTSLYLNHRTGAAMLFEKIIDTEKVMSVLKLAVDMFLEFSEAETDLKVIDIYPSPLKEKKILFNVNEIQRLIGLEIKKNIAQKILNSLGFYIKKLPAKDLWEITVPSWRQEDISFPADIVEEIARIYGYFKLPSVVPLDNFPLESKDKSILWERKVKSLLSRLGLTEVMTYSWTSLKTIKFLHHNPERYLKVVNPLSDDYVYPRQTLIPSLLEVISENEVNFPKIKIFEMAKAYFPDKEIMLLSGLFSSSDFFEIKGIVETLFEKANIRSQFVKSDKFDLFDSISAQIIANGKEIGSLGRVKGQIYGFEINFDLFVKFASASPNFIPVSKYPPVIEDITFKSDSPYEEIVKSLSILSSLISHISLISKYENFRTIRTTYQSSEKSLDAKEAGEIRAKILETLKNNFFAEIKEKTS